MCFWSFYKIFIPFEFYNLNYIGHIRNQYDRKKSQRFNLYKKINRYLVGLLGTTANKFDGVKLYKVRVWFGIKKKN